MGIKILDPDGIPEVTEKQVRKVRLKNWFKKFFYYARRRRYYRKMIIICNRMLLLMKEKHYLTFARLTIENIDQIIMECTMKTKAPISEIRITYLYVGAKYLALKKDTRKNKATKNLGKIRKTKSKKKKR